jgi:putative serine protease PepD
MTETNHEENLSTRNRYNHQFLFQAPIPLTPLQASKKRSKEVRLTFFTAVSVAVVAGLVGAGVGAGAGVVAYNYLSRPAAIVVNDIENVSWVTAAASIAAPSVVTIRVSGVNGGGNGSGVVLTSDGYILTNSHVVTLDGSSANSELSVRSSDGVVFTARLIGTDSTNDLAVIKVETSKPLNPITFADSNQLNVGSSVVAIGAPLGLEATVTGGIISALNRTIQVASSEIPDQSGLQFYSGGGPAINLKVIQTDAAINPGNSGGALVNEDGELIGVNVAIATAGGASASGSIGVGFAIPSNVAKRIADEIIASGSASHGLLGALVSDAQSSDSGSSFSVGVRVEELSPGGAAELAGIQVGDIITHFNGTEVKSASELTASVRQEPAGTEATIDVLRGEVKLMFKVKLQDADASK